MNGIVDEADDALVALLHLVGCLSFGELSMGDYKSRK